MEKLRATVPHVPITCLETHGGFGFAEDFDIKRKFRKTRLYQTAPISPT